MSWSFLLLLACPIMMLFCMKGMFSGKKDSKANSNESNVSQQEMQNLQIQMGDMMEQNHKLMKELESRKQSSVVDSKDELATKRDIS